jgi:hypothetical protein
MSHRGDNRAFSCRSFFSSSVLQTDNHFSAVAPKVGCTAPEGTLRGKGWQGALKGAPLERVLHLFTSEVNS